MPRFTPGLIGLVMVAAAAAAVASGTAGAGVSQTPVATACPAAFELLSVRAMEAIGPYYVPRQVDTAGNKDGYVCGLAQPDAVRDAFCKIGGGVACELKALNLPHYVWRDDDSPAYQAP